MAAFVALLTTGACSSPAQPAARGASPSPGVTGDLACTSTITVAPLPTWARAGFTPPDQSVAQVHGVDGSILGVVFGDPLRAPNVTGHNNKILWVPKPLSGTAPSP
ncbi:MAG TPA: hypothetical protein VLV82_07010, partial [Candidatus Angelobacter sp.]|nr:hypothetical protein [Candidatus Angelobacter sp.]